MEKPPLHVLTIFGTRPEAVKMAPVIQALRAEKQIRTTVCVTAQHREMLDQILAIFNLEPDVDLNLMQPNQSLSALTALLFDKLDPVIADLKPDWILIQGDTTSVMVASLIGYYHQILVGHVEAGLRTHNKWQPFPEEVNRQVAGLVADLHFAPTEHSRNNLLREGVTSEKIIVTGNTVIDALQSIQDRPLTETTKEILNQIAKKDLVLVTAHRRENLGEPLENICQAVKNLAINHPNHHFVFPVHLNPLVQEPVRRILGGITNITLSDPLDYLTLVQIMRRAQLVLTDSGGIQEEATAMQIPTLVLRNFTERPEGTEAGYLTLVGSNPDLIVAKAAPFLQREQTIPFSTAKANPFGDGQAAKRIVQAILNYGQHRG